MIETIECHQMKLGLYRDGVLNWFEFETEDQSADILSATEGVLRNHKIGLKDITAIAVNQGPGSFTGVRVGITVGNALAWSLNIPIVGYREGKLETAITKISQKNFSKIALPSYQN